MKIAVITIALHLILAAIAFLTPIHKPLPRSSLVVKTIKTSPAKPLAVSSPYPATTPKPAPATQKPVAASQTPPKPKSKPKPTAKKKSQTSASLPAPKTEKPSQPSIPSHLLKELEDTLSKMESNVHQPVKSKQPNQQTKKQPLSSETCLSTSSELSIQDQQAILTSHLQQSLHLPEFGEVKIELVLSGNGRVKNLKVLRAESKLNREYLEKYLPSLEFPPVNLTSEKREYTYILTFCNEL